MAHRRSPAAPRVNVTQARRRCQRIDGPALGVDERPGHRRKGVAALTPNNGPPLLPQGRLNEYWEHMFRCSLTPTADAAKRTKYSQMCTGTERLNITGAQMTHRVDAAKIAVQTLARALGALRRDRCPGVRVNRLRDCLAVDGGVALAQAMQRVQFDYPSAQAANRASIAYTVRAFISSATLRVSNVRRAADGAHMLVPVGRYEWRGDHGSTLTLTTAEVLVRDSRGALDTPTSVCVRDCRSCLNEDGVLVRRQSPMTAAAVAAVVGAPPAVFTQHTFADVFTAVLIALALFGMLVCLVCMCYFRRSMAACGTVLMIGGDVARRFVRLCRATRRVRYVDRVRTADQYRPVHNTSHRHWRGVDDRVRPVSHSGDRVVVVPGDQEYQGATRVAHVQRSSPGRRRQAADLDYVVCCARVHWRSIDCHGRMGDSGK